MSSPRKKNFKSSPRHIHFPHFFSKHHHKPQVDKDSTLADARSSSDEKSKTEIMIEGAVKKSNIALWAPGDTPRTTVGGSISGQKDSPAPKSSPRTIWTEKNKGLEFEEPSFALSSEENELSSTSDSMFATSSTATTLPWHGQDGSKSSSDTQPAMTQKN